MHSKRTVGLIKAFVNVGQRRKGVEYGPLYIENSGIHIKDYGQITKVIPNDTSQTPGTKNLHEFIEVTQEISQKVENMMNDKDLSSGLLIGGDHSIATGSIIGHCNSLKNEEISVIWVDAHGDINPPSKSLSGNLHGCPLSFVCKDIRNIFDFDQVYQSLQPCIETKNIAFIGLRDLDQMEEEILESFNITHFSSKDIQEMGIKKVLDMALEKLNPDFDIDSLDPIFAPSTGTPVDGGLSIREAMYICNRIQETGKLNFIDLVEVNPLIGSERDRHKTVASAVSIIRSLMGATYT